MTTKCSRNLADSESRVVCSANLQKHLTLLKQECNQIVTLHNNGYKVPLQILKDYNEHKRYVTELLKQEKMESYNTIFKKSR